jgi:hypothetical protein
MTMARTQASVALAGLQGGLPLALLLRALRCVRILRMHARGGATAAAGRVALLANLLV